MTSGIYQINNIETGAFYVGQSVDVQSRLERHAKKLRGGKHINKHLQNSWNKWDEDAFTFEVLELCPERDLNDREKYWLGDMWKDKYELCYNKVEGGGSGRKSTSTRAKMSIRQQGSLNSMAGKVSPGFSGRSHSDETKAKMSAKRKGKQCGKDNPALKPEHQRTCKWCGKTMTKGMWRRWHNDNCKHKEA